MAYPATRMFRAIPSGRRPATYGLIYALFFILSIVPIWTVHHPPLQDYPNHLARLYILSHAEQPPLNLFFEVDWTLVPNLALDLIVPLLGLFLPLHVAGKLFLTLTFFVLTLGALLLSKSAFGRLSPLPFLSFLFLYNGALYKGFLNFLFSCGLAFLFIHLWIRFSSAPAWRRTLLGTCSSMLLFCSHLYGLAIYALFTLAYEVLAASSRTPQNAAASGAEAMAPDPGAGAEPSGLTAAAERLGIWVSQFVLPATAFFLISPTSSGSGLLDLAGQIRSLVSADHWLVLKLVQLRYVIVSYDPYLDLTVVLTVIALALGVRVISRCGMPKFFLVPIVLALALYLFLPTTMLTSSNADWRLLVPLAFVTAAALPYPFTGRYASAAVFSMIGLLLTLETAVVVRQWQEGEQLYQNYRKIITALPRHARLFTYSACSDYSDLIFPTPALHLSTLAVIDRHAFVPSLFAFRAQQVLRYRDGYEDLQRLSSRIFYGAHTLDWDYVGQNYEYALNIDRGFHQHTTCRPPSEWQVVGAAGRLTLLRQLDAAELSATARRRSGPRSQRPDG